MKRILPTLLLSALTLPSYTLAQGSEKKPDRWYEVEIIVFETLNVDINDSEYWPTGADERNLSGAIELLPNTPESNEEPNEETAEEALSHNESGPNTAVDPGLPEPRISSGTSDIDFSAPLTQGMLENEFPEEVVEPVLPTPYKLLQPEEYQLLETFDKLKAAEAYKPLIHVAWRQIVPPRKTPDVIHLHSELPLPVRLTDEDDISLDEENTSDIDMSAMYDDDLVLELPIEMMFEEDELPKTVDGTVSIGLGRYLHVATDLALFKPLQGIKSEPVYTLPQPPEMEFVPFAVKALALPEPQEPEVPAEFFHLKGTIRMPSGEVHYLDHPHGGMLIMFTRYEIPEPELEDAEEDSFPDTMN
ncbi:CsiV family protein [Pseudomonadota bacterium]